MKIEITLVGAPRSKKNSSRIVWAGGRQRIIPSKPFEQWNKYAQFQLAKWRSETGHGQPLEVNLNCRTIFYLEANSGDILNYQQAVADALQEGLVVKNDSQFKSFDGSRLRLDRVNPRVEITLEDYIE